MPLSYATTPSPLGELMLVAGPDGLRAVHLPDRHVTPGADWVEDLLGLAPAAEQLAAYFAGERREFDLPLAPPGTPFDHAVWGLLQAIPYGETRSYGELALRLGRPERVRAVGRANARNPVAIVVPCHRVVGADGALVGYAGGLERKRALLALERAAREPTLL